MSKYRDHTLYHVYNRGAHRAPMFLVERNYHYCLQLLAKYCSRYNVSLLAYCLMPNHYHLVLFQRPSGSISRCIQTTFNAYVQGFNRVHRHSGTMLQGEAKSRRIDSDLSAVELIRYLHLNPVRAGLRKEPEMWPHSDYRDWINNRGSKESLSLRRKFFENSASYRDFVREYRDSFDKRPVQQFLFGL